MLGPEFSLSYLATHATLVFNVCSNLASLPHVLISPSGRSCLLADQGVIATTNLFDGVDYYNLANQRLVDSLRMPIVDNVITPITSDNTGSLIVGGSNGVVQVFQPFPAADIQTLELECEWRKWLS